MNKTQALLASALLVAPLAAFAAGPVEGDKSFTMSGSGTSDNEFDNTAYGVSGEFGYFLTDAWQAGVRQSISGLASDNQENYYNGSTRGFIMYNFNEGSKYRPFLGVNLGGIYGEQVVDSGTAGVETGLKLYVLEKTYLNFGVEYAYLFEDSDSFQDDSDDGVFLYNIGVGFNW